MANRRDNYRHSFPATAPLRARCELGSGVVQGEIVDLSVGGMKLRIEQAHGSICPGQSLRLHFRLPGQGPAHHGNGAGADSLHYAPAPSNGLEAESQEIAVEGVVVHGPHENDPVMGIRFLPLRDSAANEAQEKAIWTFLLSEQWRLRRLELAKLHG